jgi:hypothetical protein
MPAPTLFITKVLQRIWEAITSWFEAIAAKFTMFSWQMFLMLSALSWFVYLIVLDQNLKQFVGLYGWGFLILGVDWFFLDDKEDKKKPKIPGLKTRINVGPWVTGALICLALLNYRFLLTQFSEALVAWPLVSVGVAALRKFLVPGFSPLFRIPSDAGVRQDLILLGLIGALFSCWFQFGIFLENVLDRYPSMVGDDFRNSAFVIRTSPAANQVPPGGVTLLNTIEAQIRQDLSGRSWLDVQRWFREIETQVPRLQRRAIDQVYGIPARTQESQFWELRASFEDALPNDILRLRLFWLGPSSQAGGYALEKVCLVQRAGFPPSATSLELGETYQMECQPIISNLPPREPERPAEEGGIIEFE